MSDDTLAAILQHGLSVRQIPESVTSTLDMRHFRDGDQTVERYGRQMCQRTRIPENAGWWMCKQVRDTSSTVHWSPKDNLAQTLAESVAMFLQSIAMPTQ